MPSSRDPYSFSFLGIMKIDCYRVDQISSVDLESINEFVTK